MYVLSIDVWIGIYLWFYACILLPEWFYMYIPPYVLSQACWNPMPSWLYSPCMSQQKKANKKQNKKHNSRNINGWYNFNWHSKLSIQSGYRRDQRVITFKHSTYLRSLHYWLMTQSQGLWFPQNIPVSTPKELLQTVLYSLFLYGYCILPHLKITAFKQYD